MSFVLGYCLPALITFWGTSILFKKGEIEHPGADVLMLLTIIPIINWVLLFIYLVMLFKNLIYGSL